MGNQRGLHVRDQFFIRQSQYRHRLISWRQPKSSLYAAWPDALSDVQYGIQLPYFSMYVLFLLLFLQSFSSCRSLPYTLEVEFVSPALCKTRSHNNCVNNNKGAIFLRENDMFRTSHAYLLMKGQSGLSATDQ